MEVDAPATGDPVGEAATPNIGDSAPAPEPSGRTFTQEDVDRMVGQRAAEAERATRKRLLDKVGATSVEQLEATMKAQREAEEASRTEVEKAIARASEEWEQAKAERAAIAAERHSLNVSVALTQAGARGDLGRLGRLLDVEVGAEPETVQAAVDSLKADPAFSSLFGPATAIPSASEPQGGGPSSRPANAQDSLSRGAAKAQLYNEGKNIPRF